jgi:hypothetical protein
VEFEFTPRAYGALMADMMRAQSLASDKDKDESGQVRVGVMNMLLGGKSVPVALGLAAAA